MKVRLAADKRLDVPVFRTTRESCQVSSQDFCSADFCKFTFANGYINIFVVGFIGKCFQCFQLVRNREP